MLWFYRSLTALAAPLALRHLRRRAAAVPELAGRWRERLGTLPPTPAGGLWLHAASVGELNGCQPLIRILAEQPQAALVLSTLTHTGAQQAAALFGRDHGVAHRFSPLDRPVAVRRWLDAVRPARVIIAETEIWPELFAALAARRIPLALVNARISTRAFHRYRLFSRVIRPALAVPALIACQTETDAQRFITLGAAPDATRVTGNLKFDPDLPRGLPAAAAKRRRQLGMDRPLWVAGSTHEGEEAIVLQAHRQVLDTCPRACLILAPRHPERAERVARLVRAAGLAMNRWDDHGASAPVVLIDRIGALLEAYAAADACFVGGSLVPVGGHNLLEPALLGRPVLAGPYLQQQDDVAAMLRGQDALMAVGDARTLAATITRLLTDAEYRARLGAGAGAAASGGSGARARTLQALTEAGLISPAV